MLLRRHRRQPLTLLVAALLVGVTACSAGDTDAGVTDASTPTTATSPSVTEQPSSPPEEETEDEPPGMRVRPTFFGMHEGRVTTGVAPDAPVGALRFWDSGTSWLHVETSPGQFSWGPLDTAVATSEAAGARPLLVMGQTPTFHASQPAQEAAYGPGAASMPDVDAWRRYVTAVAERYGDRIDYQVWNETNIVGYWAGTPRQMAQLTLVASRAIRGVVPRATVVAPPFALRLAGQRRYFEDFWSLQSRRTDLAASVDAVAVHLYPPAEELPETQVRLLAGAREVLAEQGVDLPVWNTEINFGLLGGPEPPPIPEERQRAFLMRTYLLNAGLGVERVYWYRWDIGRIANTYLTEEDVTTETLAGRSFDVVRTWLGGTVAEGCLPSETERGVWSCTVRNGREERSFWWRARGPATRVVVRDAVSWTDADGEVTRCRDTCRVPLGETPVMVVERS